MGIRGATARLLAGSCVLALLDVYTPAKAGPWPVVAS